MWATAHEVVVGTCRTRGGNRRVSARQFCQQRRERLWKHKKGRDLPCIQASVLYPARCSIRQRAVSALRAGLQCIVSKRSCTSAVARFDSADQSIERGRPSDSFQQRRRAPNLILLLFYFSYLGRVPSSGIAILLSAAAAASSFSFLDKRRRSDASRPILVALGLSSPQIP